MSRTDIDIDDELVAEVMLRYGLRTKKEAVDLALRRLVGSRLSSEFLQGLEGIGWEGDLGEMRRAADERAFAQIEKLTSGLLLLSMDAVVDDLGAALAYRVVRARGGTLQSDHDRGARHAQRPHR
jgi:Arc/MetJ family transcription regulator